MIRKEFKSRERLIVLIFLYSIIFLFAISFKDINRTVEDYRDKKHFKVKSFKIDTTENLYGGSRGSIIIYIRENNIRKYVLFGLMANGSFSPKYSNEDSVKVFCSKLRKNYVYLYEENFWEKRLSFLLFRIFYLILGFFLIVSFRKQHKKVKQLAPYGVDENYEPLPKPEEKFNYNKYN